MGHVVVKGYNYDEDFYKAIQGGIGGAPVTAPTPMAMETI